MASNDLMVRNGHCDYPTVSSFLEDFFGDPWNDDFFQEPVRHLSHKIISSDFPASNLYVEKKDPSSDDDKDSTYVAELAVAGYKVNEVNTYTDGNSIVVELGEKPKEEDVTSVSTSSKEQTVDGKTSRVSIKSETSSDDSRRYFQAGIKHPTYAVWSWDTSDFKLDLSTTKVSMKDGILKISIQKSATVKNQLQIESE
jgi:HSP20 family molecular chaperone IbpA